MRRKLMPRVNQQSSGLLETKAAGSKSNNAAESVDVPFSRASKTWRLLKLQLHVQSFAIRPRKW